MPRNYRFTILEKPSEPVLKIDQPELLHQVLNVLRIKPGHKEKIELINGSSSVYEVELIRADKKELQFKIIAETVSERELKTTTKFYIPMLKSDAMYFMVQKLTELGVQELQPVNFSRVQKQNFESFKKQKTRLEKIIQEATEQCEGAVFTELNDAIDFADIKADAKLNIYASERLAGSDAAMELSNQSSVNLLIGPEGGLSDEEVDILDGLGFEGLSLGSRLLKAETAAIVLFAGLKIK